MLDIKKRVMNWALLSVFPIGWYFSFDLLTSRTFYYTVLSLISLLSASLILKSLGGSIKREVHLWIIFILYVVGYYIKFYLLCFLKLKSNNDSDYINMSYSRESDLLNNTDLIIHYYEMITIVFCVMAILFTVLTFGKRNLNILPSALNPSLSGLVIHKSTIKRLVIFSVVSSLFLMYIQVQLGLGFVSGDERQMGKLPFHLAGIIMTIYNGVIPLLFLIAVWLADTIRSDQLVKLTTGSYLIFGVVAGALSTSKAQLMSVVITLLVLWLVTGRFTRRRLILLLTLVPFIIMLNAFFSVNRILRVLHPDYGIFEVMEQAGLILLSLADPLPGHAEPVEQAATYLGFIMRINGADSLMHIISYSPPFSFNRILHILFESPVPVNVLFATDVLGVLPEAGLAFSPSLLGYYYFLFGNVGLVCCGMAFYILVWHLAFRTLLTTKLRIEPIIISIMIVTIGFFTSEGTLESMPRSMIQIIAFAILGEFIFRAHFKSGNSQNSRLTTMQAVSSEHLN